jgi:hypothetical protein
MSFVGKFSYTPTGRYRKLVARCLLCGNKQSYTEEVNYPYLAIELGDDPSVVPLCKCYDRTENSWCIPLTMVEDDII